MGRIRKGTNCSVKGCNEDAVRSLDIGRVKQTGINVEDKRRAYLCKEHYREFKKGNKKIIQIEKWRYAS